MTEKKILFTDLDGTLLSDDLTVSPKNREAIEKALGRGHYVVLSTGRPTESAKRIAGELGLTMSGCYMITFNGSVLYDCFQDKIMYETTIPLPDVRRLFGQAEKEGIHIQTYDGKHVLAEKKTEELLYYTSRTKMRYRILPDIGEQLTEEPYKALLVCLKGREILEKFRKDNLFWTQDRLNAFFSSDLYLEYCPVGVDKGSAVLKLCEILGIPAANTVAAGDEWNDISMIKAAHTGVAVKNAVTAAKKAADYITEHDNDHDAVAEIIEKFLL